MPDIAMLGGIDCIRIKNMIQTYLKTNDGSTARVRMVEENQKITYIKTVKNKISALSHYEEEHEIDIEQYNKELKKAPDAIKHRGLIIRQ